MGPTPPPFFFCVEARESQLLIHYHTLLSKIRQTQRLRRYAILENKKGNPKF